MWQPAAYTMEGTTMSRDEKPHSDRSALDDDAMSPPSTFPPGGVSRRSFLGWSALAGAASSLGGGSRASASSRGVVNREARSVEEASIAELQELMEQDELTSRNLVQRYLFKIDTRDRTGPCVNSVIEINPDALDIAGDLDDERRRFGPRGPLHGIPVLLKGNIDTGDEMQTTAGSLALEGDPAAEDSTVAARLRAAGAVILGKANLSEWANFRGFGSSSGWSGIGGQTRNPYVLDRNPCGSSSGSAAAVASNFCAAALGTETDGSIVCPSGACGVVGIKPTVGLTSRAGVIPISHTQDTVGPHGRTVADAAAVLGALTGVDPRDPATAASAGRFHSDYTQFLDPEGLQGARIGVLRHFDGASGETDAVYQAALDAMASAGAVLVDPAVLPNFDEFNADSSEIIVLVREFKQDLNAYLATRTGVPVATMADVIQFNLEHAEQELRYFGQEWFELSEAEIFSEQDYQAALATGPRLAGAEGIDALLAEHDLDALVAPTGSPAWPIDLVNGDAFLLGSSSYAAVAGYPLVAMPAGPAFGLPVGISFMGTAYSEPTLIRLASGFEAATRARRKPAFVKTLPLPKLGENLGGSVRGLPAASAERRLRARLALGRRMLHGL
jgi:amidase